MDLNIFYPLIFYFVMLN